MHCVYYLVRRLYAASDIRCYVVKNKPVYEIRKRRNMGSNDLNDETRMSSSPTLSNHNPSLFPAHPGSQPGGNGDPNTDGTANSPETVASPTMTLPIDLISHIHGILISGGVNDTPKSSPSGRHHSHDTPVRGEVFHAPHDGDENWGEGEGTTIPKADKSSSQVKDAWV